MIITTGMGQIVCAGMLVLSLAGCNKKPEPIKTTNSENIQANQTASKGPKTENDLYIERLNLDVTIENPDALLDAVNNETAVKR